MKPAFKRNQMPVAKRSFVRKEKRAQDRKKLRELRPVQI